MCCPARESDNMPQTCIAGVGRKPLFKGSSDTVNCNVLTSYIMQLR